MKNNQINIFLNYKIYRLNIINFLFIFNSSLSYLIFENNQLRFLKKKNTLCFLKKKLVWNYLHSYLLNYFENFSVYNTIYKFKWFRFVLFSGLGYKRRFFSRLRIMLTYIADRHWILYKFNKFSTVIPTKKRNFIFFSTSKGWFARDYGFFSDLRTPYVYKTKGFLDRRIKKRFLFARRIRLRGVRTKLSKKQKML